MPEDNYKKGPVEISIFARAVFVAAVIIFIVISGIIIKYREISGAGSPDIAVAPILTKQPTIEKIISSEVTAEGCKIKINTTKREFFLTTGYAELYPKTRCYQFLLNKVSPSGKYVVFQDISGGVDSSLRIYSLEYNENIQLNVLGTSEIFDIAFLPDDKLISLSGYKKIYNEQFLLIYDIPGLFMEYPLNIDKQYKYFTDLNLHEKSIALPDIGKDYSSLLVSENGLKIYETGGMNEEFLKEYSFADLTIQSVKLMPISNSGEITDWKTLKSSYFGFEIKFPADWSVAENFQIISNVGNNEWWPVDTLPKDHAGVFFERTGVMSMQEIISKLFVPANNSVIISDSVVDVNGLKSRQITYTCINCQEKYVQEINKNVPGTEGKIVFFEQGNSDVFYLPLVYYKNDARAAYYMDTFNQMLSTFKFVESHRAADWKIYKSDSGALFSSEKYTIKYPADWNYSERRIAGDRKPGNLETIFQNNKNDKIVTVIAGDTLSNYQDKKYIYQGEVIIADLNYKFFKPEEASLDNIIYVFDTGENLLADPAQKGYDEVIVFNTNSANEFYLVDMLSTFKFGE